jgi:hypothetical protein
VPIPTHNFIRVLSDAFTPVRSTDGQLLGCVPRVSDNAELLRDRRGTVFELRIAAQVCVCVDLRQQTPESLDGFVCLDDTNTDLALPVEGTVGVGGDDPDLADGV